MLSTSAAALLDGVRVLHQERPRWLELVSLDVTVTSAVDGAVVTRWLVDEAEIRRLTLGAGIGLPGHNGTVVLPAYASKHPQVPVAEQVSMIGLSGLRPLPGLHGDSLRRVAEKGGMTVSPAYDRVLTVSFPKGDLDDLTELSISVPYIAETPRAGLLHSLRALNPVARIEVKPLWGLQPEQGVGLVLPEEVQTDQAVVAVRSSVDPDIARKLERLRSALEASPKPVLRGTIATRQLMRTAPVLRQAAANMRAEEHRLGRIVRDGVDATEAKRIVNKAGADLLAIVEEIEDRADRADRWRRLARIRVTKLVGMIDRAHDIYTKPDRHLLTAEVKPVTPGQSATGPLVAVCPAAPIEDLTIVYSTPRRMLRLRRLGTTSSLLVLGGVLLLMAWRMKVLWPLEDKNPATSNAARTDALEESRDSLVALLVIFPALLYTQLERIGSDRRIFDSTVDVSLFCASVAFLLPVTVAVLTVGDLRPDLVIKACTWAGAGAVAAAAIVAVLLSDWVLSRLRAHTCKRIVSR